MEKDGRAGSFFCVTRAAGGLDNMVTIDRTEEWSDTFHFRIRNNDKLYKRRFLHEQILMLYNFSVSVLLVESLIILKVEMRLYCL